MVAESLEKASRKSWHDKRFSEVARDRFRSGKRKNIVDRKK